jgi:hypothetical protein
MASALRGPQARREAASPPLIFQARRACYGAAPPASRVLRIALRATALRAALDPGDHCGPWEQEKRAGPGLPRAARGAQTPVDGRRDNRFPPTSPGAPCPRELELDSEESV